MKFLVFGVLRIGYFRSAWLEIEPFLVIQRWIISVVVTWLQPLRLTSGYGLFNSLDVIFEAIETSLSLFGPFDFKQMPAYCAECPCRTVLPSSGGKTARKIAKL